MKKIILMILVFHANVLFSIDKDEKGNRFKVVGIISSSIDDNNIAVLHDTVSKKNITVTKNQKILKNESYFLKKISDKLVIVSDGVVNYKLSYVTPKSKENITFPSYEDENIESFARNFTIESQHNQNILSNNGQEKDWPSKEAIDELKEIIEDINELKLIQKDLNDQIEESKNFNYAKHFENHEETNEEYNDEFDNEYDGEYENEDENEDEDEDEDEEEDEEEDEDEDDNEYEEY